MALPPSTALGVARAAAAKLGESEVLELLDAIGARAPFEKGDGRCLRLCHAVLCRIRTFNQEPDVHVHAPFNFLRPLLETYGAKDAPRLPLGTTVLQFIYYAHRMTGDAHYGQNACRVRYDPAYMDFMRDVQYYGGNSAMNVLRGPMFSNMVKYGDIARGKYIVSKLTKLQLCERLVFGFAIPSVRALNNHAAEDVITGGGMCDALVKANAGLSVAWNEQLCELTGRKIPHLDGEELERALEPLKTKNFFDGTGMFNPNNLPAKPCYPSKPKGGWKGGIVPWWDQPAPETTPETAPETAPEAEPTEAEPAFASPPAQ